jgi:hypothetical protein
MTTTPVEVQGTLRLDGTMWQFFQRIGDEQNASGRRQRSANTGRTCF